MTKPIPTEKTTEEFERDSLLNTLVEKVLVSMFTKDTSVVDYAYIEKRTQELLERIFASLMYDNESIRQARKEFLKTLIAEAIKAIPEPLDAKGILEEQRESTKNPELAPNDATVLRNVNCESVCHDVLKTIINEDPLLKVDLFIDNSITNQEGELFIMLVNGFTKGVFDGIEKSIGESFSRANAILWGTQKHKIKMSQLDSVLKQQK